MADGYRMMERWTLRSLAGAFLDLAIAYIFLCAAALAFAASKFFSLSLPPSPSCCPPHPPLLNILHSNNNNTDSESELESESPAPPPPLRLGWRGDEPIPLALSYGEEGEIGDLKMEELKRVVEEERAARAALSSELEKERGAAASAADEAMAMMLRLQEEKAAAEIEARQYRRMVEEKSAYDAAEIATLKEIIVRREREKLVLEMQLEECHHHMFMMINNNNNHSDGDSDSDGDINLHSIDQAVAGIDGRVYDVHVVDDQNAEQSYDKERLRTPLDRTEKETLRLQILKEISCQLEEIKKSTEDAAD